MATNPTKGVHPFILTILNIMQDNNNFERVVYSDPFYYSVFVDGDMARVGTVIRSMYVHANGGEPTAAEIVGPIMFNPAFILQIIAQTGGDPEMGYGGKGDIWRWSGVQQHTEINGQTRPLISWQ